jgi:hypothetical protein
MDLQSQTPYSDLLLCLGSEDAGAKASAPASWKDPEWQALIRLAARHGLSAYLYRRLKDQKPAVTLPPTVERRLREITLQNASRNARLVHSLGKTLGLLGGNGIPVILLKGIHLAVDVYGSIAQRSMRDVDILVRSSDLHRTVTVLFQSGFHAGDERGEKYIEWSAGGGYHISPDTKHFFDLLHPDWPVKLDVHCSLVEEEKPFRVDADGLWNRARRIRVEGVEAGILAPEDFLLYQCLHASIHHSFETGLRPFCDIFEIIRRHRDEINWEQVRSRAVEWGAERCVYLTLRISRDLLGAAVPATVFEALRPGGFDEDLAVRTRERVLLNSSEIRKIPVRLVHYWKTRRFRDLAAALLKAVFIPRRKLTAKYNLSPDSARIILYYPVRFRDMVRRWGGMTWDIVMRRRRITQKAEYAHLSATLERWLTSKERA